MLLKNPTSLNVISHQSALSLVGKVLEKGYNVQELYVDTVGPPLKYQTMIKVAYPSIGKVVVSKKADSLFPIVSAASICAKVIRDLRIAATSFDDYEGVDIGTEFGSGYPSDPVTKKWLIDNRDKVFGYPAITRFSWKTTSTVMANACYSVEWTSPDAPMFNFATGKRKRSAFFNDNHLENGDLGF
ncbi:hypothetical protein SAMD00019534_102570 [Acytostelium subglobosum LB1]|uniref:hypothetical protein n=1 Tax=Acytostelium subglobosum LB1 TaxID=1410327 RepID=UPI000644E014|nr:hypothetical protein SAMD00019534_102570 [Acytostelium subglobosum LB1]GAM27082.1 hypothetical protein SAMD00019534_102570 [Acytostelium subglobosum LB1]|eukprot:XP_012749962.1 hypothetical protein SAMD00019534_102570 [Acytostelium subglobosum LB1]